MDALPRGLLDPRLQVHAIWHSKGTLADHDGVSYAIHLIVPHFALLIRYTDA